MNNRVQFLIFGIYISISVSVCGYLYLNPGKSCYVNDNYIDGFIKFKYSILISIVLGILLFTFLKFFSKKS